jgi:NADPH:quinone reductase-like Zn-dependent oxidoreductase
MKAAVYTRYGPPDVVQITDVEKRVSKEDEVLIRVRAASVNPAARRRYLEEGHALGKAAIALE